MNREILFTYLLAVLTAEDTTPSGSKSIASSGDTTGFLPSRALAGSGGRQYRPPAARALAAVAVELSCGRWASMT